MSFRYKQETVASVISSLKHATDIARFLRESDASIERAEFKLKLADLMNALADAKIQFAEVQETLAEKDNRIAELEEAFVFFTFGGEPRGRSRAWGVFVKSIPKLGGQ